MQIRPKSRRASGGGSQNPAPAVLLDLRARLCREVLRVITAQGLTNEEVARRTGVVFRRQERWELREGHEECSWGLATLVTIAEGLGIRVAWDVAGPAPAAIAA